MIKAMEQSIKRIKTNEEIDGHTNGWAGWRECGERGEREGERWVEDGRGENIRKDKMLKC